MQLLFPNGPWTTWLNGRVGEHPVQIWKNAEGQLILAVYELKDKELHGILIEAFQVWKAEGNVDALLSQSDVPILELATHNAANQTTHYLVSRSKQTYALYLEEAVKQEALRVFDTLTATNQIVTQSARAHDITLTSFAQLPENEKNQFFAQIVLTPWLTSASMTTRPEQDTPAKTPLNAWLGSDPDQKEILEPASQFPLTIIEGTNEIDRQRAFHVHLENLVLTGRSVALLDFDNAYAGLALPNTQTPIEHAPSGFPVREKTIGTKHPVPIAGLEGKAVATTLGWGTSAGTQLIEHILDTHQTTNWDTLLETTAEFGHQSGAKDYQIERAKRIITLTRKRFENEWGKNGLATGWNKGWLSNLGRITRYRLERDSPENRKLALLAITREMLEDKNPGLGAIAIPKTSDLIHHDCDTEIEKAIAHNLGELNRIGHYLALEAPHADGLPAAFHEKSTARITVVNGRDVGIQFKDRKNYRLQLREPLSQPTAKPE